MSRDTNTLWPEAQLGCPLRANYVGNAEVMFARTEVSDGPARFRQIRNEERRVFRLAFAWTSLQYSEWESFYALALLYGMRWFRMDQLSGTGMQPMYCHMLAGWQVTPLPDNLDYVEVTFDVEAYHTAGSRPAPIVLLPPYNGRLITEPRPTDIINARLITEPRPVDVTNALSPGAIL